MKYLKIFAIALLLIFLTSCTEDENYLTSAVVNSEGHLVLTYSDGTTLDQGLVIPEVVDVEVFLVNFYNTEGHIISTQVVEEGEDAFAPTLDLPTNIAFDEWDSTFTNVTMDLNIHPIYHYETFTVSFHGTDVPVPDMTGIEYGQAVTLPTPEVPGKTFLGWYDGDGPYDTRISMKTQINTDMNLYARYEDIVYTVTYHTNGGTEIMTQEALYGDMLVFPEMPIKEDYFYNGWYYDQEEIMPVEFETMITEDKDIYISWIQFEYYFYDEPYVPDDEKIRIDDVIGDHNYVHVPSMIDGYEVQLIGYEAFRYEPYFNVYLPDTITQLYDYSFADMPNLTSIVLPESLKYIGYNIFAYSTMLSDVILPSTLEGIGSGMFSNTAIESIDIPEGIEYVASDAFLNTPLESIVLPSSLRWIGTRAFSNTLITNVIIPEGVTNLQGFIFEDCQNLNSVSLPESLDNISENPFLGASNLSLVTLHESNPNFELIDGVIFNEAVDRLEVYLPYKTDTSYQVPETINRIDTHALTGNPFLETLELPDALQYVYPNYNFYSMDSLSSIDVYDAAGTAVIASVNGVLYSADYTYLYKYPMGKTDSAYTVHTSTLRINAKAFFDNTHITSVILNNGIQRIHDYAFENCTNLSAINFPTSLTTIYNGAFLNVDGITSITLPNTILSVGGYAFSEMDNLTTLTLSEAMTYLPYYLIENSNNLTSLHIPSAISNVSYEALVGANGLTTLTIDPANTTYNVYDNSLYSEDYTILYLVPGGHTAVSFIPYYLTTTVRANFGSNPNIKIIACDSSVEYFYSNIQNLPNLQGLAFYSSNQIAYINYLPFDPETDNGFNIYIRTSLYDDYMANTTWARFEDWFIQF